MAPPAPSRDRGRFPTGRTAWAITAAVGFVISLRQSWAGARRGYSYDEGVTVGYFVDADWFTSFLEQRAANNHPLFSFAEQLVWRMGGHTEVAMRLLPATFTALTVALIGYWSARRWGTLGGIGAVLVLLSNPLFVSYGQQARGYSLLVLAGTLSTICLIEFERLAHDRFPRTLSFVYTASAAVGLATHLYMLPILAGHVAVVLHRRAMTLEWVRRWGFVAAAGSLTYMRTLPERRPGDFNAGLPWETAQEVLSATSASIVVLGLLSIGALWVHRAHWPLVAAPVSLVFFVWAVLQPLDLYARFFVWVVPGLAGAAAWAIAKRPIVVVAVAAMAVTAWPSAPPADSGIRESARILAAANEAGATTCAIGSQALAAYTADVREFEAELECDIVAAIGSWHPEGFFRMKHELLDTERVGDVTIYRRP